MTQNFVDDEVLANEQSENGFSIKLFVGYPLTSEIKEQLHHSQAWQQSSVLKPDERDIIAVRHLGHEYIGRFLAQDRLILSELRAVDELAKAAIKSYCPECNLDGLAVRIFPEVFVA